MLVVGGLIFVWALLVSAKAKRIKQITTRAEIAGPQKAAFTAAVVRVEGLIFCAFPVTELRPMNFSPK